MSAGAFTTHRGGVWAKATIRSSEVDRGAPLDDDLEYSFDMRIEITSNQSSEFRVQSSGVLDAYSHRNTAHHRTTLCSTLSHSACLP